MSCTLLRTSLQRSEASSNKASDVGSGTRTNIALSGNGEVRFAPRQLLGHSDQAVQRAEAAAARQRPLILLPRALLCQSVPTAIARRINPAVLHACAICKAATPLT
jgi:hypothetical protein